MTDGRSSPATLAPDRATPAPDRATLAPDRATLASNRATPAAERVAPAVGRSTPPPLYPDRPSGGGGWKWIIGIALLVLIVAIVAYGLHRSDRSQVSATNPSGNAQGSGGGGGGRGGGGNQPTPVVVATARQGDMNRLLVGLGSVTPFNTATIRSRVDGQIMKVDFTEGQFVKAGDPLFEIDPRPYQVMLDQAQGQMLKDQAALKNAKDNVQRDTDAKDAIAAQQLDTDTATMQQDEGAVKIDQAQIDNGKLQVDYSHITSPFAGRIGLRLVDVGNLVHATDATGLAVIAQQQPISVVFTLPEDDIPRVEASMSKMKDLKVEAYARDLRTLLATGKLLTIDNEVDPTSGTFKLKSEFTNENNALFPSQFVSARLLAETLHNTIIVPSAAVQQGPDFSYVYLVKPDKTVALRKVKVTSVAGNEVLLESPRPATGADEASIESGVEQGDVVVIDGIDKLHDGAAVIYGEGGGRGGRGGSNATQRADVASTAESNESGSMATTSPGVSNGGDSTSGTEGHHRGGHRSHDQATSEPSS